MAVSATGPSSVTAGTNATYTITITNNGPNAAQGVVLSDTMPSGSSFVSMTQTAGTDSFTFNQSGSSVTETASANIASGGSDTFSLVVFAPAGLANGAAFNDTASVSANNPDPTPGNNTATVTGSIVNNNPNADLSVTVSGVASANEGDSVTYNITVSNAGPASAPAVSLTNTLPAILSFVSATTSQGTFSVSGGVVTFAMGTIAAGGTATASVTAQAIEDGSVSDNVSVSSTAPDPNTANNSASATTSFAEPAISVSAPIRTRSTTLTNFQTATFTHAKAVEPTGAFSASIAWGDGSSSAGTISLTGTTYAVTGSHTYSGGGRHTITTTVTETGNSAILEGGDKMDVNPSSLLPQDRDILLLPESQRFVSLVYHDLLGRDVDPTGLAYWSGLIDGGVSRAQVVLGIQASHEYRADLVEDLYEHYLKRPADSSGLTYFVGLLDAGWTTEDVAAALTRSTEYYQNRAGGTAAGFLNALYQDAFGRTVDSGAESAFTPLVANGSTRAQVVALIFASQEFHSLQLESYYETFLQRASDPSGQWYFAEALRHGAQDQDVIAAIVGSDEFLVQVE
jgi:uncharacterized repeat protein (TIGR01451 family)